MKTVKYTRIVAMAVMAVSFLVLWAIWYSCYYYTLYWQEGFSFFSTLPDFTGIQVDLPVDIFRYSGAYLLQFFRNPLYGSFIQACFAAFVFIGLSFCILRLLDDVRLTWLAFIPVPIFVAGQYADITLERSILWCVIIFAASVFCGFLPTRKLKFPVPECFRSVVLMAVVPIVALGISVYSLLGNERQEILCKIDYHANHGDWQEILQQIPPEEARKDEFKLRYALLALSETGQLADRMFGYGMEHYSQFLFYGSEDPFDRNFNALFYQSLGMSNEVVHQCYQQCLASPFGFNFRSLRILVDTYLEMGDKLIASKYMEILRHTSFHQEWLASRDEKLNGMECSKEAEFVENSPFVGNFLETITSLVNQDMDNKKYVDLCLCAILTTRNAEYFYRAFQVVGPVLYANGVRMPRHYEEAILLIALRGRKILTEYNVSQESKDRFSDFMKLYQSGKINLAKNKYPDSYWSFVF